MGNWLIHDGVFYVDGSERPYQNRAFTLGDGFFETIRVMEGRIFNWSAHYQRIALAARALHIDLGESLSELTLLESAQKLVANENISAGGRIRITIYRGGGGTYRPSEDRASYVMQADTYAFDGYEPHRQGIILGDFLELRKDFSPISAFKLLGAQVYIQAARACKLPYDDMLIYNSKNYIVEATSSNIFAVKGGQLFTPPLSDGGIAGVMRMLVINTALEAGIAVFEQHATAAELEHADEIFICNVMKGCTWVKGYGHKRYTHGHSDRIIRLINRKFSAETINSV